MTRISAEPGEIACTRLLQTMFTICFVSSQFKQYAAMLDHGHHRVSLGEGRREHDGADKTLIASLCDMKTFIKHISFIDLNDILMLVSLCILCDV